MKIAEYEKTRVTVVEVIPPHEGELNLRDITNLQDVPESYGLKTIKELKAAAREEGEVSDQIIEVTDEEDYDIIILGSRKQTCFRQLSGDNSREKVIRRDPCPILVVKACSLLPMLVFSA